MWMALGVHEIIDEAMLVDRSGSAVLEEILRRNSRLMPGFHDLCLKEVVAITSWYIWWVRRRRTHNEDVSPLFRCKMSILAIAANSAKEAKHTSPSREARWTRLLSRQVKINVDAAFFEDS
jgi:hypothetical protein